VDARRLHPVEDIDQTAAAPVRALLTRLPAGGPVPRCVFDAGYDSAQLTLDLAEQRVAVLVRLRSDRCFYADPPSRAPGSTGRPRRHGAKFNCADPTTWPAPTATHVVVDDQYDTVTTHAWAGLHPKQHRHPGHGSRGPRPIVRGTILCVQVERVPARTRPPKVLWCGGPAPAPEISTLPGGRTFAGSTWSTPSGSASRPSAGPRPGRGIPSRPTAGPGWCWPAMPSCAWPARSPVISGCRGSGPGSSRDGRPTECDEGFRGCCAHWARRLPRRNPPDAPQDGPRAGPLDLPPAIRRSKPKTKPPTTVKAA
jgi:hypothetical protein